MNKVSKVIVILVIISLIPVVIISLPWLLIFGFSVLEPSPPAPEIKYGEFPFILEYKIDEEMFVVKDVIICEYDGVSWDEGNGKHRTWKKRLKQSGEEDVLIIKDGEQKIFCNVGSANYYMNDQKYPTEPPLTPNLYPIVGGEFHTEKEIMDKYKIKLIKWEFAEPIKNSFK